VFAYEGPAVIGDVAFPEVSLREQRDPVFGIPDGLLRSWNGTATIPPSAQPPLFGMPNTPTLEVVLPDGRTGRACASARCDNGRWTLEITGEGPAPGCS
jgi:hypothetical protein